MNVVRTMIAVATAAFIPGCLSSDKLYSVGSVFVTLERDGSVASPTLIWVGDTATLSVRAMTSPQEDHTLYTSQSKPDLFRFASSDTTVVTVDSRGKIMARRPGKVRLSSTSRGVVGDLWPLIVSPAVASLHQKATPASPKVGDTITVQLTVLGPDGSLVSGAETDSYVFVGSPKRTDRFVPGSTAGTFRYVPKAAGSLVFYSIAVHDTPAGGTHVADSLRVVVRP
jgi:hypothetical protein